MKKLYILSFVLLTSIFTSCEKDNCKNCYPTIFECKVDGKKWKTSCESKDFFGCTALDVQLYPHLIEIIAKNDNNNEVLKLYVSNQITVGSFRLYNGQSVSTSFFSSKLDSCREKEIDTIQNNLFKITKLDTINQILNANFEFTGKNNCGELVKITNGKIDVIYRN